MKRKCNKGSYQEEEFLPTEKLKCYDKDENRKVIPEVGKNYTTIKSGKTIVFHHEGYNYRKSQINGNGSRVFLRCQFNRGKKEDKCSGTACLVVSKKSIYVIAPHNHEPNENSVKIQNFLTEVKNICDERPTESIRLIFYEEFGLLDPMDFMF